METPKDLFNNELIIGQVYCISNSGGKVERVESFDFKNNWVVLFDGIEFRYLSFKFWDCFKQFFPIDPQYLTQAIDCSKVNTKGLEILLAQATGQQEPSVYLKYSSQN